MDQIQALDALSALANETRLQIVRRLVEEGRGGCPGRPDAGPDSAPDTTPGTAPDAVPGAVPALRGTAAAAPTSAAAADPATTRATGLPAGEIARHVAASASRLSFHLNALEQARLVVAERRGRQVFYRLNRDAMGGLIHYLLNDCCRGDPQVSACCQRRAG